MDNYSNHTILFLHIPKSGGTTLTSCLTNCYYNKEATISEIGENPLLKHFYEGDIFYYPIGFYKDPPNWFPNYVIPILNSQRLRVVSGHFSYGIHKHIPAQTKYITILREPVERIISLYYHLLSTKIISKKISLEQFIEGIPDEGWLVNLIKWHPIIPEFHESEIRKYSKCIVDNDQTRRISGIETLFGKCNESMFLSACENITKNFELVGLTEKFNETLLLLSSRLGWKNEMQYLPKLVNKGKPRIDQIPDYLLAKIDQLNYWDRKLYDFVKRLFEKNIEELGPNFKQKIERFDLSNKKYLESNSNDFNWDIGNP